MTALRARLSRIEPRYWRVFDRLLAGAFFVLAELDVALTNARTGSYLLNALAIGVIALSLLMRRTRPLLTAAVVSGGLTLMALVLTPAPELISAVLMVVAAAYSAGAHLEQRPALYGLGMALAAILVVSLTYDTKDFIFPVAMFGLVPWLAGRTIRNQTMLARELAEKAERAEYARDEEERRVVLAERSRIARELHDVLAHNLSVMVVQAGAARRVAAAQPDRAAEAAELIQRTGREALHELRQLFGPVRHGEGEDLFGPPGLARLDELAERARAAGLRVELRVQGDPVQLPTGIDLTAYRVVQEALTNALKHAGDARAVVSVSYEPNEVVLSIEDDGSGPSAAGELTGGHGLVGMRERVSLYGGVLQAGRRRGGGFAVHARLPTRAPVPGAALSSTIPTVPA